VAVAAICFSPGAAPAQVERLYVGVDLDDTLLLAPFAREFLYFLKNGLPVKPVVVVFSGGGPRRNAKAVQESLAAGDLIDGILSDRDLTSMDPELTADGALVKASVRGMSVFDLFKKDLSKLGPGAGVGNSILIDDHPNAATENYYSNVLVVAKERFLDSDIVKPRRGARYAFGGQTQDPRQALRAKYRLVQAAGLLATAIEEVQKMGRGNVPAVLDKLQWDAQGHYRFQFCHSREIYEKGMKILETASAAMSGQTGDSTRFQFRDYAITCQTGMKFEVGPPIFPWEHP
jgi:hypothetical protein